MTQSHLELIDKTGKTVGRQPAGKILKWYASAQVPPGYSVRTESGAMPIAEWVAKHQPPPELPMQPESDVPVNAVRKHSWLPMAAVVGALLISLALAGVSVTQVSALRRQLAALEINREAVESQAANLQSEVRQLQEWQKHVEIIAEQNQRGFSVMNDSLKSTYEGFQEVSKTVDVLVKGRREISMALAEGIKEVSRIVGENVAQNRRRIADIEDQLGITSEEKDKK